MNSKQDILNEFREKYINEDTGNSLDCLVDGNEATEWLLNTLTEFERETEQKVIEKILGKWNSIRPTDVKQLAEFYSFLLELEKEKRT